MFRRFLVATALAALPFLTVPAHAAACDRACLDATIDRYLAAMLAHDPTKAGLATNVKFTENGQALDPGDGLWGTISALGDYRHVFDDPDQGEAVFFGTIRENGKLALLAVRLKLADGKIAEAETIVSRDTVLNKTGLPHLEAIKTPDPLWLAPVPAADRMKREDLVRTANMYFSGLQQNDGKGAYPFADDCNRLENGLQTTNNPAMADMAGAKIMTLGCKAQFETGFFRMVTRIRDRRFLVVDEERQVVLAFAFFDHAGTVHSVTLTDGRTVPVDIKAPLTWEIAEAFKIDKGKIRRVEAVLTQSPYGMKPGW